MNAIFCPSVMCLPMDNLAQSIFELEQAGIDRFHLDVMDGVFVPNYSLGLQDIEAVCRLSTKETEVHLMTVNPGKFVRKFVDLGVDIIFIHPDSDYHPSTVIQAIDDAGAKPGVVLSPGTSVESVKDLLLISKYVCVMTVNPGQAGQAFLPYVNEKIKQLVKIKETHNFELQIDGACSAELIKRFYPCGVDSFVLGTAGLFHNKGNYKETISKLREITNGEAKHESRPETNKIKYVVTDVDGTLTDGKIYMGEQGEVMKAFDIKDGYALHELLPEHRITPVILTGRQSKIVENRASELGIKFVFQGVKDKLTFIKDFAQNNNVSLQEIAFMGDDISDLSCIESCSISGCASDAVNKVKEKASFVSSRVAGNGAFREFAEYLVKENVR